MTRAFSIVTRDRLNPSIPGTRARALVLVDRAGDYASFWPTLSSLSMAHISLHNRTEAQRVVAFPRNHPSVFRAGTRFGRERKRVERGPLSRCTYRFARSFPCSHYYITILYRDFRSRIVCAARERGVMCSHVRRGFCVPLLSVYPGGAAFSPLFASVYADRTCFPLAFQYLRVYIILRRDNLANAVRSSSI